MKKNKFSFYILDLFIATIFGILIGLSLYSSKNSILSVEKSSQEIKINQLINYIKHDYVDSINTDKLLDGVISQMLLKLDPHSVYIPKKNLSEITENMQGNFVGIGVEFIKVSDTINVIRPIKGGPSIKVGIKAGDRILIANKDTLYNKKLKNSQILTKLKGKINTKVLLQVYRKSNDSLFTVLVTRGKVNIKSVDVAYMLNDSIGYIKLNRFARSTYKEFKTSLTKLLTEGMTTLVLDLRENGGGFVDISTKIADEFLKEGKLIVFTKNNKRKITKFFATKKGHFKKGKLYILIDENTASAAEIVTGAIQDNDRGVVVGRRSFGKGLVQEQVSLADGSALRLTIARYYTPTGRCIQKPYDHNGNKTYNFDIQNRLFNGELFHKDSIKIVDSLKFKTPKGKIVYGGGGIIPDVFVPLDTTSLHLQSMYFQDIQFFTFQYIDNHRKELLKWNISDFIKKFDLNDSVYNQYVLKIKDLNPSYKIKSELKTYLKISIASQLFGDKGLYRSNESRDKMIQKVFELERK